MKRVERIKTYSIGETARLCGVTEKQLRHWEEKEHIPLPQRVICGKRAYRQFTEEDFNLIRRIKGYSDEGYHLAVAAKKAAQDLSKTREVQRNG